MKQAVIDLLSSKKGIAYLVAGLVILTKPLLDRLGYELEREQLAEFLGITATYLVGQGIADHGKAQAEISAAAMLEATKMTTKVAGDV